MTFEEFLSDRFRLKLPLESPKRFTLRELNDMVKQYDHLRSEELKKRIKEIKHNP